MRHPQQHQFSRIPSVSRPRSAFDRSHGNKCTFDAGWLTPIYVDEVLPGDTFNLHMTAFVRLATPLHPIMDNISLSTFWFFVPLRLIHDKFVRMMGEQPNPGDSTDFVTPKIVAPASTGFTVGSLFDFFGLPTGVPGYTINNYAGRAYNKIYDNWFRDENLQNAPVLNTGDGPDNVADYIIRKRGKRHDYFTSSLPWPQKGPAVALPLAGNAPITGLGKVDGTFTATGGTTVRESTGTTAVYTNIASIWNSTTADQFYAKGSAASNGYPQIYADLSAVTAATINQLREAITIQQVYELDARGGTRYIELMRAHFGVVSSDARLQRAEYLGGSTSPINVAPIAQMSNTVAQSPQGNLAAIGSGIVRSGFTKSFEEHGILMGLVCAIADLNYQQGINRMHTRSTRWDFYLPTLANLGEQVVKNKEIYVQGTANPTQDEAAFGYQERWAEYRYKPSTICGEFRSTFAQPLDTWHLAQKFTALPALNAAFIEESPPIDRIIAVTSEPHFLYDSFVKLRCVRAMPVYSVPGLRRL